MKTCVWVVGVLLVAVSAEATLLGTVNIQNRNNALSDQCKLWGGSLVGVTAKTGVYSWTNAGSTGLGQYVPDWGFCIELPQQEKNGWHDVIPLQEAPLPPLYGSPMGIAKADAIRELWGRFFDANWLTGADKQKAEAFSTAIWEIVYETDATWNVSSGTGFYAINIEQVALANSWLSQLDGTGPKADNLVAISTEEWQDFVVQIPEPATLAMLALGSLLVLRKK